MFHIVCYIVLPPGKYQVRNCLVALFFPLARTVVISGVDKYNLGDNSIVQHGLSCNSADFLVSGYNVRNKHVIANHGSAL